MNIIYIKQAVKAKVNKKDLITAITPRLGNILEEKKDNIEMCIINTSEINGVGAGGSVLLASNSKLTKYIAMSLGASTKDIWCTTDDGKDSNYNFEYVLQIDKKMFNGKRVSEVLEESKNNKDLAEALRIIGIIATGARYETLLSGRYGEVEEKEDNRYSGILVVDYTTSDNKEIDIDVIGRKGKTHLLRIVPVLDEEMKIVKYIEDSVMTELIALHMNKDNKGMYSNRRKLFNFSHVLPVSKLTDADCEKLELKKDKNGLVEITKLNQLDEFMKLIF